MSGSPIGQPVDRVDGRIKVTGAARYAADHNVDQLAHGYLVTSTIARGTIAGMGTDAALRAPGVLAVYTPFNPLPLFTYPSEQNDEVHPPLQTTEVRYYGQAIGLVVAETFEQARDAAALIDTRYDPLPARTSFVDELPNATPPPTGAPAVDILAPEFRTIDEALAASEVTVTATYTSLPENHAAMEPHATVAAWAGDYLTIYTVSQGVRLVVDRLATTLGVDKASIHVINPHVGGGFGNKWGMWAQMPLAAAAARALHRPVKTVLTREQVFTIVGHRPPTSQTIALGARRDGTLIAIKHEGISSKSASNGFRESPANTSLNVYAAPNIHVGRKIVTLDVPVTTIMRAPSDTNGAFAQESALDELAFELGIDPLEIRLRNYATVKPDNRRPWSSKHLDECYRLGAERFGWSRRNPTPRAVTDGDALVGMGMATCTFNASRSSASIKVRLNADGTATVAGTGADLGTGQSTVFSILGAARLGIPVHRVQPQIGDSATPAAANAGGSSSTSTNGPAVQLAADAAIAALLEFAATHERSPFHGMDPAAVRYDSGDVVSGGVRMSFGSLLTTCDVPAVEATATSPRNENGTVAYRSFGAHFCEVRVHRLTGEPRVSRWVSVIDAGTIVNAKAARSQITGAVIMGIGSALTEGMRMEPSGRIANANLASYLVPVNADIPPIDVHFLDYPDSTLSPLGARGIGELGIVGVTAAIAGAVHNATGKRVRDLPITLEKLLD
ncbi:MAG TPA: xanthine dehydrogenase family protein molybdopterin-binding subunit [Actinophytocola sp.]|uniref:xanthine dehydrogenase family protein molybdopterin-binding subunit n=1 Tax=Actinophytocola sp. TaxID=1872138 RepID=UPI002DDCDD96|nr:xanthine dehydrogenase family protein molybdopterin-binding subunit [Actinophytocola sp.]HEV2782234.1 xanthine dehydrogenase family protein molybdopterin-binding subunit [Actinophytocola sp.]